MSDFWRGSMSYMRYVCVSSHFLRRVLKENIRRKEIKKIRTLPALEIYDVDFGTESPDKDFPNNINKL